VKIEVSLEEKQALNPFWKRSVEFVSEEGCQWTREADKFTTLNIFMY